MRCWILTSGEPLCKYQACKSRPLQLAPIRSLVSTVEHPVQESSPGYRIQKPGAAIDPQILAKAREAAALRHGDDPFIAYPGSGNVRDEQPSSALGGSEQCDEPGLNWVQAPPMD